MYRKVHLLGFTENTKRIAQVRFIYFSQIGGIVFREVEVGGGEDFRTAEDLTKWPV